MQVFASMCYIGIRGKRSVVEQVVTAFDREANRFAVVLRRAAECFVGVRRADRDCRGIKRTGPACDRHFCLSPHGFRDCPDRGISCAQLARLRQYAYFRRAWRQPIVSSTARFLQPKS
jgi:hypothetical protein